MTPSNMTISSRRRFLYNASTGLGSMALASLMAEQAAPRAAAATLHDPTVPKPPHFKPKAKSVIFLFMEGGPSHIDLFDPKPKLNEMHGQPMPASFGKLITAMGTGNNALMGAPRTFTQHGKSGLWVSELYPHVAKHADDLAVVRSCIADGLNHVGSVCQMNTGDILAGRPSMGAWVTYGLGSANKNLPAFTVLIDDKDPLGNTKNWAAGFLPAVYQGTLFRQGDVPILNTKPGLGQSPERQQSKLSFLKELNQNFGADKGEDTQLDARIRSFELAYQMQSSGPEAVDLTQESEATKELYGLNSPATATFGRNCLMARRLVERGVRFVELYSGSGSGWDAHSDLEGNHGKWCKASDQPIAGLLTDLKQRGMLDDTLIVWGGEFGRTPFNEKGNGRDHNPWGFTMFFAGGGVRGGRTIGSTDEIGLRAVERPTHVHDIHSTILHALGLDHLRLTYQHNGRAERPTIVAGERPLLELWS